MPVVPGLPAAGGRGAPCAAPARTVRIGMVPRPRLRPLHEVLAETPPPARTGPGPDPVEITRALDALVEAARPAAVSLFGVLAEILDGRRPVTQLESLCVDGLYADAVTALVVDPARRSSSRVSGVRVCPVAPTVAEAAAVVHRDGRARALAARLERAGNRWWLAALEVG